MSNLQQAISFDANLGQVEFKSTFIYALDHSFIMIPLVYERKNKNLSES